MGRLRRVGGILTSSFTSCSWESTRDSDELSWPMIDNERWRAPGEEIKETEVACEPPTHRESGC